MGDNMNAPGTVVQRCEPCYNLAPFPLLLRRPFQALPRWGFQKFTIELSEVSEVSEVPEFPEVSEVTEVPYPSYQIWHV